MFGWRHFPARLPLTSIVSLYVCLLNVGVQLAAFDVICAQMLQDVQERLVFRTHIYIRQEILNYNPASGDLAYPSKLEMMEVYTVHCQKYMLEVRNASWI